MERKVRIRKHTRKEGEINVISHDRKIEVSRGSDKSPIETRKRYYLSDGSGQRQIFDNEKQAKEEYKKKIEKAKDKRFIKLTSKKIYVKPIEKSSHPDLSKYKSKSEAIHDLNAVQGGDYDEVVDYVNENW